MFHGKDNREFNNSTDIPERCGGGDSAVVVKINLPGTPEKP